MSKKLFLSFFLFFLAFLSIHQSVIAQGSVPLIIDHNSLAAFDQIPRFDNRTIGLRSMLRHASVGDQINIGLDCLQGTRDNPVECTLFPDYAYDRRNWSYQFRGNPSFSDKIADFDTQTRAQITSFDVFAFKFCFIDYANGNLSRTPQESLDQIRLVMENLEREYPAKKFVWWTVPLTRTIGYTFGNSLNSLIRSYVRNNNKILFDIADIESYNENNIHLVDGNGMEIAYQEWCGETAPGGVACHPNWPGNIRLAKAYWVLMYQLAHQLNLPTPTSGPIPSSTPSPRPSATPTSLPTVTSTPPPSPTPTPSTNIKAGDANRDGKVDGLDYVIWLNHYNQQATGAALGDFNNSGFVDGLDYVIWRNNYNL